jgi:hypothetical protein
MNTLLAHMHHTEGKSPERKGQWPPQPFLMTAVAARKRLTSTSGVLGGGCSQHKAGTTTAAMDVEAVTQPCGCD